MAKIQITIQDDPSGNIGKSIVTWKGVNRDFCAVPTDELTPAENVVHEMIHFLELKFNGVFRKEGSNDTTGH